MTELPMRIFLLLGLLAHKAVWEVMKRQVPAAGPSKASPGLTTRLVKLVKIAILLGIAAQTLLPEILPLTPDGSQARTVGVVLYTIGLAVALMGRIQLGHNWSDIESAVVHSEHRVVSRGIYKYIRHPIYTGDLLLLVGLELALNSWLVVGALLLIPITARQAIQEEQDLATKLPGYDQYCRRTKRFLPFVA